MLLKLNVKFHWGPFLNLFLVIIYVNDIVSSSSFLNSYYLQMILFFLASHTNLHTLVELINFELDKVSI